MNVSYYQNKLLKISQRISVLKKEHHRLGFFRLLVFISALIFFLLPFIDKHHPGYILAGDFHHFVLFVHKKAKSPF
jgi:hypothetical protein